MRVILQFCSDFRAAAGRAVPLALFTLALGACSVLAQSQLPGTGDIVVVVDLPERACNGFWPALELELAHSKTPRLLGGSVVWMTQDEFRIGMQFRQIYQLRLLGDCTLSAPSNDANSPGPLGRVLMVNGEIQPFVYVDCDRVARVLERELRCKPALERRRILARAIARVVAHEMTHIVTQSTLHAASGLQRAHLSSFDLLSYYAD
jgi:hypothetical protein